MDVLVVGGGGREHALAWKLKQSPRVGKLYVAPGNAGTANLAENVPIGVMEFEKLAAFAREKKVGLTIPGPDDAFVGGIVDVFKSHGLRVWGPTREAAQIEGSKAFAKQLMHETKIPTAEFGVFTTPHTALAHVRARGVPIVIKASGLALGKGVYVCRTVAEAEQAIQEIMVDRAHKGAGDEIVIEEYLDGPEISIHALTDGSAHILFPPSQDHKPALDGDQGKNTGGMGTIAPVPWVTTEMMAGIDSQVVAPTFEALEKRGTLFQGLLFPGLKVTLEGPKVLEYNARFGDPETQVYMRLLKTDVLDLFEASVDGTLDTVGRSIEWNRGFAVNVVIASGGYPDAYKTGFPVSGIMEAEQDEHVVVFHAGTKKENGILVTSGGRVLGVSAIGGTLKQALDRAYAAVDKIHFEGMHFRRDIGARSLS
ncbi:phosphoribosylamine--glycine ligase [Candidatus Kaiserbacteria bacterium RIFCSPHIGHO2_02_FULL_54_11b]|uniref:Phosphoribosylamine--glycine ligase n=2 Tax=Candidatus Kaiseribacteriota TaxID=1752734 RepID=A0A1F6CS76_9BACT|nr:MAG: phosphoribosylamine--glycine ligase [Candidatus Kaiserbacteria bacterium RIFCSPHIGHO2_01_FULL_54_36b]OGG64985.1 MAG: phosphoribosylamine--glycine ligase [Candidatus Kaiserbacteria bacterium RIFCSPHIGHO2_02_FULL_54_11b]